jgi:hypothetical protein
VTEDEVLAVAGLEAGVGEWGGERDRHQQGQEKRWEDGYTPDVHVESLRGMRANDGRAMVFDEGA